MSDDTVLILAALFLTFAVGIATGVVLAGHRRVGL